MGALAAGLMLVVALVACKRERKTTAEVVQVHMQSVREAVRKAVDDEEAEEQLLALVDELATILDANSAAMQQLAGDLWLLNADPESTLESFESKFAEANERRKARRDRALEIHFEMAALTNSSEWKQIANAQLAAIGTGINVKGVEE
jgi:hypothetical protein